MITLVLHRNGERLQRTLGNGVYRIGREQPADLVIADSTISAIHAEMQVEGATCIVRDLGSRNGTFLNGTPVRSATNVGPADRLQFGSVVATIEIAASARPSGAAPPAAAAQQAVEAEVAAARRVRQWSTRSWTAAFIALAACVLVTALVLAYSSVSNREVLRTHRFATLAAQYANVLTPASTSVPPPSADGALRTLRVHKPDGTILYPAGTPADAPSPLFNTATKRVFGLAKEGLYELPGQTNRDGEQLYSYPVRRGGELVGYVTAAEAAGADSAAGFILACTLLAGMVSAIVLFLAMRPVHRLIRTEIARLQERISAVVNGVMETLPRSEVFPELNAIAATIENGLARRSRDERAGPGGIRHEGSAFDAELVALAAQTPIAYCFVDSDYTLLHVSSTLRSFYEFSAVRPGQSLFGSTLSTVQARDLVQTINGDGAGTPLVLDLQRGARPERIAVYARRFLHGGKTVHGVLFCPPPA